MHQPYSIVDDPRFRKMITDLSDVKIVKRQRFTARMEERFEVVHDRNVSTLQNQIQQNTKFVASYDGWKSDGGTEFFGFVLYYIDASMTRCVTNLPMIAVSAQDLDSESQKGIIKDYFKNYNLTRAQISFMVTDGARSVKKAVDLYLGGLKDWNWCLLHRFNLIMKDWLDPAVQPTILRDARTMCKFGRTGKGKGLKCNLTHLI